MRRQAIVIIAVLFLTVLTASAQTATTYQQPSADIVKMLDQPPLPQSLASPDGKWLLLTQRPAMPTIADLSQPMLRLAGTRISPRTNSAFQTTSIMRLTLVDLSTNRTQEVSLPPNPHISYVSWSPDSRRLAFTHAIENGL